MSTIRTFIAVDLSPKIRANAGYCIERLRLAHADYNWVAPENMHITLNFLGDVRETEINQLCHNVQSVATRCSRFQLTFRGMGGFPQNNRPRVIWLGATNSGETTKPGTGIHRPGTGSANAAPLMVLQFELATMLRELGFPKDRNEFSPHLTLGRLRRHGRWNQALTDTIQKLADYDAGSCQIDQVAIYSSHLGKSGPTYTAMAKFSLSS